MTDIFKKKKNGKKNRMKRIDTVQKALFPVRFTSENGVFTLDDGRYSKSYLVTDVNYMTADKDGKRSIFLKYSEFLNSMLDSFKITVMNRRITDVTDMEYLYFTHKNDSLDYLRDELNTYIRDLSMKGESYIQEIYVTVICNEKKINDANRYFNSLEKTMQSLLNAFSSRLIPLSEKERLMILRTFYNSEDSSEIKSFDHKGIIKRGYSTGEFICPDSVSFEKDYMVIGDMYARSMVIKDLPQYLKDTLITDLLSLNIKMSISVDAFPVSRDEAIKMAEEKNVENEINIVKFQNRQNNMKNWAADIPFEMQQQRAFVKEFLEELTVNDQRMFFCTISLVHMAKSREILDRQTKQIMTVARSKQTEMKTLTLPSRQRSGLLSALPISYDHINYNRTLLSHCLAVFIPFKIQDILHSSGIICGVNAVSGNLIRIDRKNLKNGNAWILGKSGGGKSFFAKQQILNIILSDSDADIMIIDPEREYTNLVKELKGEVIDISSNSVNHINPLDMNENYSESTENPIASKSEFIISVFEQITDKNASGKYKSIIDRCLSDIYREYIKSGYKSEVPTFKDLRDRLLSIDDTDISKATAQELALDSEIFITGSLNTFAKKTNVEINNRLVCYDILELGSSLLPVGMLVVLDNIFNRLARNREKGKNTYIFIDEIYLLFAYEYTAEFLYKLWKRIRKYGGYVTGITQNVEDLLQSKKARTMLSNSEFVTMLAQSTSDRDELARLLNISNEECRYITERSTGEGIIHVENKNIPFVNRYDKNMKAYRLLSTKPGENKVL